MIKDNKIIKLLKKREETISQITDELIEIFYSKLKWAIEKLYLNGRDSELIIHNTELNVNNINYLNVMGQMFPYKVGDEIDHPTEKGKKIKITSGNIVDFSFPIILVLPIELLNEGYETDVYEYLIKLTTIYEKETQSEINELMKNEDYKLIFENPAVKEVIPLLESSSKQFSIPKTESFDDIQKSILDTYKNYRTTH